jgi:hypothetical protein
MGIAVLAKVKNVGKPYAGEPHVRFDEEGLANPALYSTKFRTKLLQEAANSSLRTATREG